MPLHRTCELLRFISLPTLSSSASASLAASTWREMQFCVTLQCHATPDNSNYPHEIKFSSACTQKDAILVSRYIVTCHVHEEFNISIVLITGGWHRLDKNLHDFFHGLKQYQLTLYPCRMLGDHEKGLKITSLMRKIYKHLVCSPTPCVACGTGVNFYM